MSEPGTERGFTVRGIEPERHIYDFQITIDADFADELRALEVPEQQEAAAEHIEESLTHDMADVRFVGDSFLLHGITVGFQATGLDLHNEERGRQTYATHNVDAPSEAIEVISAFSQWEAFANRLVEDRREDDGLRADGGPEQTGTEQEEVPRTDICEECDREIVAEVEAVTGKHELIHAARKADEGFMPVTGGTAEIVFSCRCSHMRVEYGPGSTSAWKVPDAWMWEDEVDVEVSR